MTCADRKWSVTLASLAVVAGLLMGAAPPSAAAQTIIDEWASIKAPPPPELKAVMVDPKTTALLILDIAKQTCNQERRPRCLASLPAIQRLLTRARANHIPVVYSVGGGGSVSDILREVEPIGNEPVVSSGPDKFLGTDLEKILKEKGIQTVIVVGTAAHGAVLYTASEAAFRGFKLIIPVDGVSAETMYAEQYVAWNMVNAPGVGARTTLTKIDLIQFP